ncbi:MAG: DUF3301 domain-containing protein [Chromatiales bacterium]
MRLPVRPHGLTPRPPEPEGIYVLTTVIILALLALAVWFWANSTRAREMTLQHCGQVCRDANVQFLDQTVALSRLRLARDARQRLLLQRTYSFEFSTDGQDRHRGLAVVLGLRIEFVRLEHPSGPFIMTPGGLHVVQ